MWGHRLVFLLHRHFPRKRESNFLTQRANKVGIPAFAGMTRRDLRTVGKNTPAKPPRPAAVAKRLYFLELGAAFSLLPQVLKSNAAQRLAVQRQDIGPLGKKGPPAHRLFDVPGAIRQQRFSALPAAFKAGPVSGQVLAFSPPRTQKNAGKLAAMNSSRAWWPVTAGLAGRAGGRSTSAFIVASALSRPASLDLAIIVVKTSPDAKGAWRRMMSGATVGAGKSLSKKTMRARFPGIGLSRVMGLGWSSPATSRCRGGGPLAPKILAVR